MYEYKGSKSEKALSIALFLIITTILAISSFSYVKQDIKVNTTFENITVGLVVLLSEGFSFFCVMVCFRKMKLNEKGVYIKYPLLKWKFLPWEEFQDVCLQYPGPRFKDNKPESPPIYLVKNGIKKHGITEKRWPVVNLFLHVRGKIIEFSYSDDLYHALLNYYPGKVNDCREQNRT